MEIKKKNPGFDSTVECYINAEKVSQKGVNERRLFKREIERRVNIIKNVYHMSQLPFILVRIFLQ